MSDSPESSQETRAASVTARVDRITAKLRQSLDYELREALQHERQRRRKAEDYARTLEKRVQDLELRALDS